MSPQFTSEQLVRIRDEARIIIRNAANQEDNLEALVAAAETDVGHAEAALAHALDVTHVCVDDLRSLLCTRFQRSLDGAEKARKLSVGAREQHVAARRLLANLDCDRDTDAPGSEACPSRDAVLVVDDYGDVRQQVSHVLQKAGFVVRTAANGLEALLAAYEMRPEVIIMDVSMPVLDGIEATRLIKATEATRHARVIAYTGEHAFDESLVPTLFAAVLQKPAAPDVVVATVQHAASL
jgi:CheY-like chemotaxis protein